MPHVVVAPIRRWAVGGEDGDVGHVVVDAELAQLAQDDGSEEEGDGSNMISHA
jgi:1,4-dihydroxy-2-naphthoyl-CoA synthase